MWKILQETLALVRAVSWPLILVMLGLFGFSLLVNGARFRIILSGVGISISVREATLINWSATFVSNVTPGKIGGEVFRVLLLKQRQGVDTSLAAVAQGYDRATDVLPMTLMVLCTLPMVQRTLSLRMPHHNWLVGGAAAAALLTVIMVLFRWSHRLRTQLRLWADRFARFRIRRLQIALALGCAFLLLGLDFLRLWVAVQALGASLDPLQIVSLSAVALIGGLAPTIGGLGTVEGGLTAALCLFGVSLDKAIAITLLERSISYGLCTAGGGVVLGMLGGGQLWRSLRRTRSENPGDQAG